MLLSHVSVNSRVKCDELVRQGNWVERSKVNNQSTNIFDYYTTKYFCYPNSGGSFKILDSAIIQKLSLFLTYDTCPNVHTTIPMSESRVFLPICKVRAIGLYVGQEEKDLKKRIKTYICT